MLVNLVCNDVSIESHMTGVLFIWTALHKLWQIRGPSSSFASQNRGKWSKSGWYILLYPPYVKILLSIWVNITCAGNKWFRKVPFAAQDVTYVTEECCNVCWKHYMWLLYIKTSVFCAQGSEECESSDPNKSAGLGKKMKAISLTMRKRMGKKHIKSLSEETVSDMRYTQLCFKEHNSIIT